MKRLMISKQSILNANRVLVERKKASSNSPLKVGRLKFSAKEINSAYRKALENGKKL